MSPQSLYRPIDREPKLADRATQQLQGLITGEDFKPGDRLPSERELSELLGVSRTVVREALRALSAKGLVEVRGGAGAFVRAPSMGMVSEMLSICLAHTDTGDVSHAHVLQLRRALETEMASLAAEHRDDADLAELQRLVDDLGREGISAEEYARVDTGFHDALARAGKNPLFPLILRSLADIMVRVRLVASSLPGSSATSFGHHRRILEEVRKGSAAGARRAMQDHLLEAETTARRALARIASPVAGLDGSSRNGGQSIQD